MSITELDKQVGSRCGMPIEDVLFHLDRQMRSIEDEITVLQERLVAVSKVKQKVIDHAEVDDPISLLGLNVRIQNALIRSGIFSICTLTGLFLDPRYPYNLLAIRNYSDLSHQRVCDALLKYGIDIEALLNG